MTKDQNITTLFTIAVTGTAVLGIIGLVAEPQCVSSAVGKGLGNSLNWAADLVFAFTR